MIENASIIREKRKSIKITITQQGEIVIYSPFGVKNDKLEEILQSKKNILSKKLQQIKSINNKYYKVINREYVLLFGKMYAIIYTEKVKKATFTEEYLLIPTKYKDKTDIYIKKSIREIAQKILFKRVKEIIQIRSEYNISKLIIGDYKSKWGSCDNFGVIKFNWRLVMVPPKLVDFVIMHELTHLKELNHSSKFYAMLSNLFPDWKESRETLKEYSFLLNLY